MKGNLYVDDVRVLIDETDDERPLTVVLLGDSSDLRGYLSADAAQKLTRELQKAIAQLPIVEAR